MNDKRLRAFMNVLSLFMLVLRSQLIAHYVGFKVCQPCRNWDMALFVSQRHCHIAGSIEGDVVPDGNENRFNPCMSPQRSAVDFSAYHDIGEASAFG